MRIPRLSAIFRQFSGMLKLLTITLKDKRSLEHKAKFDYYATQFQRYLRKLDKNIKFVRVPEFTGTVEHSHVHFHYILATPRYFPQKALSDKWREITGDSYIVDIRKIRSKTGFFYVLKYLCKPITCDIDFYVKYLYKSRWLYHNVDLTSYIRPNFLECDRCGSNDLTYGNLYKSLNTEQDVIDYRGVLKWTES